MGTDYTVEELEKKLAKTFDELKSFSEAYKALKAYCVADCEATNEIVGIERREELQ